mmetsp:Transcript_104184/g.145147  ORF Transcript_104184/g.145147 Transcript_104184/m.145147 type:complete len:300 (-) Transcript_104184:1194-2093(-)
MLHLLCEGQRREEHHDNAQEKAQPTWKKEGGRKVSDENRNNGNEQRVGKLCHNMVAEVTLGSHGREDRGVRDGSGMISENRSRQNGRDNQHEDVLVSIRADPGRRQDKWEHDGHGAPRSAGAERHQRGDQERECRQGAIIQGIRREHAGEEEVARDILHRSANPPGHEQHQDRSGEALHAFNPHIQGFLEVENGPWRLSIISIDLHAEITRQPVLPLIVDLTLVLVLQTDKDPGNNAPDESSPEKGRVGVAVAEQVLCRHLLATIHSGVVASDQQGSEHSNQSRQNRHHAIPPQLGRAL